MRNPKSKRQTSSRSDRKKAVGPEYRSRNYAQSRKAPAHGRSALPITKPRDGTS
jgi:hypothetical protein